MKKQTQKRPTPTHKTAVFPPRRGYASLSMKDLLDARDAYHVYLSSLENVTATAIGRYLIHEEDWYADHRPGSNKPAGYKKPASPRTLANSVIRPWSWPAVLVFVKQWESRSKLGPNAVPQTLYLPDGRIIPVCVLEAKPDPDLPASPRPLFPTTPLLGGGYACLRENQGEEVFGTFACLVRKGGTHYALTNRHVAGGEGDIVSAYMRGQFQPVGITTNLALDRVPMPKVFPGWAYDKTLLKMDAGLVRIDDITDWTSQAFGIGEIGELFDATEASLTLDLIGTPVRAFTAKSGGSEGEIRALFFRYESLGGFDDVTDALIGPRYRAKKTDSDHPFTQPGDSGSLWFYDPAADEEARQTNQDLEQPPAPPPEQGERAQRLRPIAMQWGGERLVLPDGAKASYALATFLSSVCTALEAEVERDWSRGHEEFWGKIGHFSIGFKACEQLPGKLGTLMKKNQARIGLDDAQLSKTFKVDPNGFVPLADVPDYVWITHGNEPIQHFADVDIKDIDGHPTLLARCVANPKNIAASVWKAYFDGFAKHQVGPEEGALPFRVWQIYDAMVDFVKKRDLKHFVAAAGILAHYVGDASQPLHASFMHHGIPPMKKVNGRDFPVRRSSPEFEAFKKTRPYKIHGIYEETMLEIDPAKALSLVDLKVAAMTPPKLPAKAKGHDAAIQVIRLMHHAQARLSPLEIINADDPSLTEQKRATALWNNLAVRNATVKSLADSIATLAAIWEAAWNASGGLSIPKSKLIEFSEAELQDVYRNEKTFIPSQSLDHMVQSKKFEP